MSIQKGLIYGIIPARSGSTSVKDKNIRLLNGYPMIAYSIGAALLTKEIKRTIVSTDSEQYRSIALKYGADVPFLRPKDISGPNSTDLEFMNHAIDWLEKNGGILPEYWVHLRPTTPYKDLNIIAEAIELKKNDQSATSLRSGHRTDLCPYKWFKKNDQGYFESFCGITNDEANNPRQHFPSVYIPNGYVDILKTKTIFDYGVLYGDKMIGFEVSPTIDVDYERDFINLQKNVDSYVNPIMNWLSKKE